MGRASSLLLVAAAIGCGRPPIIFADEDTDGDDSGTSGAMTTVQPPGTTAPPDSTSSTTFGTADTLPGTDDDDDFGTTFPDPVTSGGVDSFTSAASDDSSDDFGTAAAVTSDSGTTEAGCNEVPGVWADCIDGEDCMSPVSVCAETGTPGEASCLFECDDVCDCPAAPPTGNPTLRCDDIYIGDGIGDCYLSCEEGEDCPDGHDCFAGFLCVHSNVVPSVVEPYEGCSPPLFECPDGTDCIDNGAGDSSCIGSCMDASDCLAPPAGGTVACDDITGDLVQDCYLDCDSPGTMCPDDWFCFGGFVCLQPSPS